MTQMTSLPTQDSSLMDFAPPEHTMPKGDNEMSDKYCKETDTCHPSTELLNNASNLKTNSPA